MTFCKFFLSTTLLFSTSAFAVSSIGEQLAQGDEFLNAGLYPRAIATYQKILESAPSPQTVMEAQFRLGLAYLAQEEYSLAVASLTDCNEASSQAPYLLALAKIEQGQYEEAKKLLISYLKTQREPQLFHDEARFGLGCIEFLRGDHSEAESTFQALASTTQKTPLKSLANIYLARLSLVHGNLENAQAILEGVSKLTSPQDPISFELSYLLGEVAFQQHNYPQAISYFTSSLPTVNPEKSSWYSDALYHLGWSYLKSSEDLTMAEPDRYLQLQNAVNTFKRMVDADPQEKGYLALSQSYLSQINRLNDNSACQKAEAILSQAEFFTSAEGKCLALLLRAEAAPNYELRKAFYKQLTEQDNETNPSRTYMTGVYKRLLNDLEHADSLPQAAQDKVDQLQRAWKNLDALLISPMFAMVENPTEAIYLHGYYAARLAEEGLQEVYLPIAAQSLKKVAQDSGGKFADLALSTLGATYFRNSDYANAEGIYLQLVDAYPDSPFAGEAWYWLACCAEQTKKDEKLVKQRKQYVFEHYTDSPYAPEAYFMFYSYDEYLQGDKLALKHLQNFEEKFSQSPYLIEAHFLLGLDHKRDRKTAEGKWIRKKSLTDAIDSFQQVEIVADLLAEKGLLPQEKMDYYTAIRRRALLEGAMANLAIAEEGQGAKRQVYLDYAEEMFTNLIALSSEDATVSHNAQHLLDEGSFGLAQVCIRAGKDKKADEVLVGLIERHRTGSEDATPVGYYVARAWEERGRIAMQRHEYLDALQYFKLAEEASKGSVLSTDQHLDLWIQQSLCCRALGRYDDSILTLSKVVNDDAVSSLRLKAMYMRAETYEIQGRPELARKQLESMVKKGGDWSQKAREKLERDYGY